jgi:hypothetical protein
MEALRECYDLLRQEPFPTGGRDDDLDELHADLALADSWVAESVIPFVERGSFAPAKVDVLQALRTMREQARGLRDPDARSAYLRYIDLLSRVYETFLRAGGHDATESLSE